MKPRILIVSDDASQRASFARWLLGAGYAVELAEGAKRAREVAADENVALAIVAGRPGADPDLADELRGQVEQLILIDEPAGSADPADDRGSPPLSEPEFLARVRTALRVEPGAETAASPQHLRFEGYTLDTGGRVCVDATGRELPLTRAEFALLLAFGRMPGRVLSRDELRRAVIGRPVEPDDRSIDMMISRLRRKIEPDPKAARIIITVPGEGYKFTPRPLADLPAAELPPAPLRGDDPPAAEAAGTKPQQTTIQVEEPRTPASDRLTAAFRPAFAGLAAVLLASVGAFLAFWLPGYGGLRGAQVAATSGPRFDPATVPLVSDAVRAELAVYSAQPNFKALAISTDGWGAAFGAADHEGAQREALERCKGRSKFVAACRIYASGMEVVWPRDTLRLPLPADIHAELLDTRLVAAELPALTEGNRRRIAAGYVQDPRHRALAIKRGGFIWHAADGRDEAVRVTLERCSDFEQVPCLLVSVDGFLTVEIPKSRRIVDIFMLATENSMSEEDKRNVGRIYEQKGWRALARGNGGGWYPIANASSESDAIEAALRLCAQQENGCRLFAVSNFRVADE